MDHETTQVRPGDLITAQLFNTLIARIAELEARVGDGGTALLEVPRLVGLTLGQGQTLLSAAGTGFSVGSALDVFGAPLNPNTNASRALRVLKQVPPPGALASIAGAIDVVLAAPAGDVGPQPTPAPTLSAFSPIPVEIGAELVGAAGIDEPGGSIGRGVRRGRRPRGRLCALAVGERCGREQGGNRDRSKGEVSGTHGGLLGTTGPGVQG